MYLNLSIKLECMHWFLNPIQNHYTDFNGRATRKEYWMFLLGYIIVSIVLSIILEIVNLEQLMFLLYLGLLAPSLAIGARRLHDTNRSGWWQLLALIPFVGGVIVLILMAFPAHTGANKYASPVVAQAPVESKPPAQTEPETKIEMKTETATPAQEGEKVK